MTTNTTIKEARIITDAETSLDAIKDKTLAVIGFGSQGHAHALNLKDSGCKVIIGLYPGSKSRQVAADLGFEVMDTADAVKAADVIFIAVPDTSAAKVFNQDIAPSLTAGKTILFSHGFAIHFKTITAPADINVVMVAPKGPGHIVRRQFTEGKGVPGLIAIYQDVTGNARDIALSWAKGVGCTRGGVIETTFEEETVTDLFGEQCVLCGGASALVKAGFEVLVEAGYQPEMAYFECLHELKLIVDLMNESGIHGMRFSVSETAEWGDVSVGPKIIDASVKARMAQQLKDIQSGKFAKEWIEENENGCKTFNAIRQSESEHLIESTGERLRSCMSWIKKRKVGSNVAQASYN